MKPVTKSTMNVMLEDSANVCRRDSLSSAEISNDVKVFVWSIKAFFCLSRARLAAIAAAAADDIYQQYIF
jgi:hypothetical protein